MNTFSTRSLGASANPTVQLSWGEFIDKLTILEIKEARLTSLSAVANVQRELKALRAVLEVRAENPRLAELMKQLKTINEGLWKIEDKIRTKESAKEFDHAFIVLARSIYFENDKRGYVKRQIDLLMNSAIVEEKQYIAYNRAE